MATPARPPAADAPSKLEVKLDAKCVVCKCRADEIAPENLNSGSRSLGDMFVERKYSCGGASGLEDALFRARLPDLQLSSLCKIYDRTREYMMSDIPLFAAAPEMPFPLSERSREEHSEMMRILHPIAVTRRAGMGMICDYIKRHVKYDAWPDRAANTLPVRLACFCYPIGDR